MNRVEMTLPVGESLENCNVSEEFLSWVLDTAESEFYAQGKSELPDAIYALKPYQLQRHLRLQVDRYLKLTDGSKIIQTVNFLPQREGDNLYLRSEHEARRTYPYIGNHDFRYDLHELVDICIRRSAQDN